MKLTNRISESKRRIAALNRSDESNQRIEPQNDPKRLPRPSQEAPVEKLPPREEEEKRRDEKRKTREAKSEEKGAKREKREEQEERRRREKMMREEDVS